MSVRLTFYLAKKLATVYLLWLIFKLDYFPGWLSGEKVENNAKLSPAGAGAWDELSNILEGLIVGFQKFY